MYIGRQMAQMAQYMYIGRQMIQYMYIGRQMAQMA